MASDIWLRTILIVRKETRCCHIGYSFRLPARVLLYAPSHRQDSNIPQPLLHQSVDREIAQWVHSMKDRSNDPSHHKRTLLPQSYILLLDSHLEKNPIYIMNFFTCYILYYHNYRAVVINIISNQFLFSQ